LDAAETFTDRAFHAKDPSRAWRQIELSWLKEIQRELLCSSNSVLASFRLVVFKPSEALLGLSENRVRVLWPAIEGQQSGEIDCSVEFSKDFAPLSSVGK
jgi:hypothetical protein